MKNSNILLSVAVVIILILFNRVSVCNPLFIASPIHMYIIQLITVSKMVVRTNKNGGGRNNATTIELIKIRDTSLYQISAC